VRERDRELRRRRHRRKKIRKLLTRLQTARTDDERQKLLEQLARQSPARAAEVRRTLQAGRK